MSGRLIISSKKSYCPWKPENVERVLRDEARHERNEQEQQRRESSRALLSTKQQHVNFFAEEERKETEALLERENKLGKAIMPVYLDTAAAQSKNSQPFYLRDNPFEQTREIKDEKLKSEMDPMQAFTKRDTVRSKPSSTALRVQREVNDSSLADAPRRTKKSKNHKRKESRKHSVSTMEKLRTRRLERERKERSRQEVPGHSGKYNDQYLPTLTRK